ncbi:hypothetical protein ACGC1H_002683 [Rhizoctonia solani]
MFMHPTGAGSGHESEMIYAPLALSAGLFILVIPSSTASAQGSSSKSDGGKSSELSSILKALGLESKRRESSKRSGSMDPPSTGRVVSSQGSTMTGPKSSRLLFGTAEGTAAVKSVDNKMA